LMSSGSWSQRTQLSGVSRPLFSKPRSNSDFVWPANRRFFPSTGPVLLEGLSVVGFNSAIEKRLVSRCRWILAVCCQLPYKTVFVRV
jgi:hypothetical protein